MWPYPEIRNLGDYTRFNARRFPDKPALVFEDNTISMFVLDRLTNQFANALIAAGVEPRQRVVFYGSNSDDFLIALLGTAKATACFVPLNWRLSIDELVVVVADAEPSFAIVATELQENWRQVTARHHTKIGMTLLTAGKPENNPFIEWLNQHGDDDPQLDCPIDDTAWILYTSGTTGSPKGVELMHSGLTMMRMCESLEPACTWSKADTFLFVAPNFHLLGIGLTIQAFFNGATIAIMRAFEPKAMLLEIEQKKPTILALAPVMIQMMLNEPAYKTTDFRSIREIVYAGSTISLGLIKQVLEVMSCQFMQFYGSTESGGAITLLRPEEHDITNEKRLTSCGRPLPLIDIRVMDPDGKELPDGEAGEMWIRTPSIAKGYCNKPKMWAKVYDKGWFKTGDVAYRDEEGYLYIVDRLKDIIITGGENVYCSEVENCLSLHQDVQRVAVIGVPSKRWGEEVKACIVLSPGAQVDEADLITYARAKLADYKCPKTVDFFDELPLAGTGKVLKRQLREYYWREQGQ